MDRTHRDPLFHDALGRLAIKFRDGEPASGLPSGAALAAFVQYYGVSYEDAEVLAQIVRVMRGVEDSQ